MECAENYCGTVGNVQKNESIHRASPVHIQQEYIGLDCSLLGATGNALYRLYESSGRSLHRPTYAYY